MIRTIRRLVALGVLVSACSSTGVGNPGATMELALTSDPQLEPESADAEQLETSSLLHAILVFGELRFIACDPSDPDVTLTGRYVVDLVTNKVAPSTAINAEIPPSGFCGIDAKLAPALAPAAVAGRSILFSGVRSDGTRFLLYADIPGTLHMRPRAGLAWPIRDTSVLWALRPRRWLTPTELDGSDTSPLDTGERIIAIDANQHPLLYALIRARLAQRSTLHIDTNENGALDTEERTGSAFIGQGIESID